MKIDRRKMRILRSDRKAGVKGVLKAVMAVILLLSAGSPAVVGGGCGRGRGDAGESLREAELLMKSSPDSATRILDHLDSTGAAERFSTSDRHLYSLLRADSRYHADSLVTEDKALEQASEYFYERGDYGRASRSHYLLGDLALRNDMRLEAVVEFMHAAEVAEEGKDTLAMAMAFRGLSDSYYFMHNWTSSKENCQKAISLFRICGDKVYWPWETINLATTLLSLGEITEAGSTGERILSYADSVGDIALKGAAYRLLLDIYSASGKTDNVLTTYSALRKLPGVECRAEDYLNVGLAYLSVGNIDKARMYLDTIEEAGGDGSPLKVRLQTFDNDYKGAYNSMVEMVSYQNSAVDSLFRRDYATVLNNYYKDDYDKREALLDLKNQRHITLIIILVCLTITLLTLLHFQKKRLRHAKAERQQAESEFNRQVMEWVSRDRQSHEEAASLRRDIDNLDREAEIKDQLVKSLEFAIGSMETEIDTVKSIVAMKDSEVKSKSHKIEELESKLESISVRESRFKEATEKSRSLVRQYLISNQELMGGFIAAYEVSKTSGNYLLIAKELDKYVTLLQSQSVVCKMEKLANECFNDLIKRLDAQCRGINKAGRLLYIYNAIGVPGYLQCLLLDVDSSKLWNRKAYLKKKIQSIKCDDKDEFLFFLR